MGAGRPHGTQTLGALAWVGRWTGVCDMQRPPPPMMGRRPPPPVKRHPPLNLHIPD